MQAEPLITLNKIAVRLYDRLYLQNTSWETRTDENWAIVGPDGSGKTTPRDIVIQGMAESTYADEPFEQRLQCMAHKMGIGNDSLSIC